MVLVCYFMLLQSLAAFIISLLLLPVEDNGTPRYSKDSVFLIVSCLKFNSYLSKNPTANTSIMFSCYFSASDMSLASLEGTIYSQYLFTKVWDPLRPSTLFYAELTTVISSHGVVYKVLYDQNQVRLHKHDLETVSLYFHVCLN